VEHSLITKKRNSKAEECIEKARLKYNNEIQ